MQPETREQVLAAHQMALLSGEYPAGAVRRTLCTAGHTHAHVGVACSAADCYAASNADEYWAEGTQVPHLCCAPACCRAVQHGPAAAPYTLLSTTATCTQAWFDATVRRDVNGGINSRQGLRAPTANNPEP